MKRFKSAIALLLLLAASVQAQVGTREYNAKIDFGAVADGTVDDSDKLQTALTAIGNAGGGVLYLPQGSYYVGTGLTYTTDADLEIRGPGTLLVEANTNGLSVAPAMGDLITPSALASVASSTEANAPNVTEVTATAHGLAVGDVIKIVADDTYDDLRSVTSVVGELAIVATVDDANTFTLNKELEDIATSDTGIVLRKLPAAKIKVDVRVTLTGDQAVQSTTPYCVRVANAVQPRITVDCDKSYQTVLLVENCFGGEAKVLARWAADDGNNGVYGYGLRIGGGTTALKGSVNCGAVRHAVTSKDADGTAYGTTDALMAQFGRTRDITITDSLAVGCTSSAFDTHPNAERWTFQNCKAIWSGIDYASSGYLPVGFQVRGRDQTYVNCESVGGRSGFEDVSTSAHNGNWRTDFLNCRAFQARLRGIHVDQAGIQTSDTHHVRIDGGVYDARSASATFEDGEYDISDCEFRYYGFTHPVTVAQTTDALNIRFRGVLFNHTTDNDRASISVTKGTADVQVLDCYSQLAANLQQDGLFEGVLNTTSTLTHHNWQWTTGRTHQGLTSGTGTITSYGSGRFVTGSGAPSGSVTPDFVGQDYFDTSGGAWYKATGLTNTDWQTL